MWYTLKRLSLGLFLIALAAAILLISDWNRRTPQRGEMLRIAVFQFATRPLLDDVVRGALDGLASGGFVEGRNLEVRRFSAENDLPTANNMAKAIVDGGFKMVITASTPCLQTMAAANKEGKVLHLFAGVTDPFGSGVGLDRNHPLDHPPYLFGVGSFQPVKETFRLAKQLYPGLKTVGVAWNPAEACSEACTVLAREACQELGIQLLEANVDSSSGVKEAAESLVSRGVQALWIGGDNTVDMASGSVIALAKQAKIPVFTNLPDNAKSGALFGMGANYYEVGKIAGELGAEVLNGRDPKTIRIENVVPRNLAINQQALSGLRDPWKAPETLVASATEVIDEQGHVKKSPATTAAADSGLAKAPLAKKWRIHFLNYIEAGHVEEAQKGVFEEFKKLGLVEGRDYEMHLSNAQGDMATLTALVDAALTDRADMILLTSTPTLQAVLQKVRNIPVIFSNVSDPIAVKAGRDNEHHLPNVTGISTQGDFVGMVRVLNQCLPRAKRVGTLFVPAEVNSVINKNRFIEEAQKAGIEVVAVPVSSSADVSDAALSLAGRRIDAICQVPDNLCDSAFTGIATAAKKEHVPLFAFVSDKVFDGGAAIVVARDYEAAGRDIANLALRIMHGESPGSIPFRPVSRSRIICNLKNAALYGLEIPESFLKDTEGIEVIGK